MISTDYMGSLVINNTLVNIGQDDYGQCYYFEYVKDGELVERGCGTYCFDFIEQIVYTLDRENYDKYDYQKLYEKWEKRNEV